MKAGLEQRPYSYGHGIGKQTRGKQRNERSYVERCVDSYAEQRDEDQVAEEEGPLELGADIIEMLHPDYQYSPLLVPLFAGPILVIAYNAELFGGAMHTDFGFAVAWGAFPVLTGYVAQAGSLAVAPVLAAAGAFALSAAQRAGGVVAASVGNHGQGVALAAAMLGTTATVYMPVTAALPKLVATRGYGAQRAKMLVEPAGAAAVAALVEAGVRFPGPVCAVLSGGNVDPLLLMRLIGHGLGAAGRFVALQVTVSDRPGNSPGYWPGWVNRVPTWSTWRIPDRRQPRGRRCRGGTEPGDPGAGDTAQTLLPGWRLPATE